MWTVGKSGTKKESGIKFFSDGMILILDSIEKGREGGGGRESERGRERDRKRVE